MLRVFLDESGTHAGSLVTTMGGFVMTEERAASLELSWREQLSHYGMQELHMREFVPPHGRYSHWSNDEKRNLLAPLIALIRAHTLYGVGAAVVIDEYMNTWAQ